MRKTNHVPWMGRTVVTAVMLLVGIGVFASSASAQMSVYPYDDAAAWWASFDCDGMKRIIPQATGETTAAHQARACSSTLAGLKTPERRAIEDFVTALNNGPFLNHKAFWNDTTNASCLNRARVAGRTGLAVNGITVLTSGADAEPGAGTLDALLYCVAYDGATGLRPTEKALVDHYLTALSGRAMMTDDEEGDDEDEAPALPLVGVGILGLLLAGRGAWLRRRA